MMLRKYQKYVVLWAAVMVSIPACLGTFFGNLFTYIYSLQYDSRQVNRQYHKTSLLENDLDPSWMLPFYYIFNILGVLLVDVLKARVGLRLTMAASLSFSVAGPLTTYFTVGHSIWATTLTLMVVGGIGNGAVMTASLVYVVDWFRPKEGLAAGLVCGAGSIGGVILNAVITSYINPHNLSPDTIHNHMRFFSQPTLLDRVPRVFLILGTIAAGFQVIGFCFLKNFPKNEPLNNNCNEKSLLIEHKQLSTETCELSSGNTSSSCTEVLDNKGGEKVLPSNCLSLSHKHDAMISGDAISDGLMPNDQGQTMEDTMLNCENSGIIEGLMSESQEKYAEVPISNSHDKAGNGYENEVEVEHQISPTQFVKTELFYVLELAVISQALGSIMVTNYFKLFAQVWINDDTLLALTGSCLSICAMIIIPCFGTLKDRIGIKNVYIASLSANSLCLSLWYFTPGLNKWLYVVCTVALYGVNITENIIWSVTVIRYCGTRHFATNFGLLQLGSLLVYIGGPPFMVAILSAFGWFWLFYMAAILSFLALLLVLWRMPSG